MENLNATCLTVNARGHRLKIIREKNARAYYQNMPEHARIAQTCMTEGCVNAIHVRWESL